MKPYRKRFDKLIQLFFQSYKVKSINKASLRENTVANFKGYQINNEIWGFSGSGYLEPDARNSEIAWQIYSPISDSFNMVIVWANGSGIDKKMELIVNGALLQEITFKSTRNYNKWNGKVVNIPMKKGENILCLSSQEKGPSIDFIYFTEPIFESDSMSNFGAFK